MKKRLFLVIIGHFIINTIQCQSWQWIQLIPDTAYGPGIEDGILFGDTAVIMGGYGKTFYSTDFFQTYTIDSTYNTQDFEVMEFASRDTGYIETGYFAGGLLATTDGGLTFHPYANGNPTGFGSFDLMQFTHGDTAYNASTLQNNIYRVGMNFHQDHLITPTLTNCNQVIQIRVTNDSTIYMLSTNEFLQLYLARSNDYGNNWQLLSNTGTMYNGDFRVLDDTTIIVVGYETIVKSKNGGITFDTVAANLDGGINVFNRGVYFVDRDTGFATLGAGVYRTYDAGDTWFRTDFAFDAADLPCNIEFITASSSQKVIIGCAYGEIYKTTNGGGLYTGLNNVTPLPTFTLSPNPTTGPLKITPPTNTGANYNIEVTNLLGQPVYKTNVTNNQINISNLAPGMYLLNLEVNGAYQTTKFVKQ